MTYSSTQTGKNCKILVNYGEGTLRPQASQPRLWAALHLCALRLAAAQFSFSKREKRCYFRAKLLF